MGRMSSRATRRPCERSFALVRPERWSTSSIPSPSRVACWLGSTNRDKEPRTGATIRNYSPTLPSRTVTQATNVCSSLRWRAAECRCHAPCALRWRSQHDSFPASIPSAKRRLEVNPSTIPIAANVPADAATLFFGRCRLSRRIAPTGALTLRMSNGPVQGCLVRLLRDCSGAGVPTPSTQSWGTGARWSRSAWPKPRQVGVAA